MGASLPGGAQRLRPNPLWTLINGDRIEYGRPDVRPDHG
jgi:hypothetical protein